MVAWRFQGEGLNMTSKTDLKEPITDGLKTDPEIEEEIERDECDCECECGPMTPKTLIKLAIESKQLYLDKHRELKTEKARLRLETDWSKVIPGKSNPNDTDKKEYITFETHELQEEVDDLKCEADYMWELWEIEKIMLRKR